MRKLLEIGEIAQLVGLPRSTIYQQRHRRVGIGGLAIRVGRHLRWRPEDLERWLEEQAEQARKEFVP